MIDKIAEQRDYLDNVVRVDDELIKLADFTSTSPILGIAPYKDRIVGFTDGSIFQILIDQVQAAVEIAGNAIAGNYFVDQQKLLLLTSEGKLIEYEDGNTQFADTADVEWKKEIQSQAIPLRFTFLILLAIKFGNILMVERHIQLQQPILVMQLILAKRFFRN